LGDLGLTDDPLDERGCVPLTPQDATRRILATAMVSCVATDMPGGHMG
jgi:hypothetical protein